MATNGLKLTVRSAEELRTGFVANLREHAAAREKAAQDRFPSSQESRSTRAVAQALRSAAQFWESVDIEVVPNDEGWAARVGARVPAIRLTDAVDRDKVEELHVWMGYHFPTELGEWLGDDEGIFWPTQDGIQRVRPGEWMVRVAGDLLVMSDAAWQLFQGKER